MSQLQFHSGSLLFQSDALAFECCCGCECDVAEQFLIGGFADNDLRDALGFSGTVTSTDYSTEWFPNSGATDECNWATQESVPLLASLDGSTIYEGGVALLFCNGAQWTLQIYDTQFITGSSWGDLQLGTLIWQGQKPSGCCPAGTYSRNGGSWTTQSTITVS